MRLMIVDDSYFMRNRIKLLVEELPLEIVAEAANGIEAVEKFREVRPEIVTMDITMPGMNGLECIKDMMSVDPGIRILVVSGLASKIAAIMAIEYGAKDFLKKPFTDEQLKKSLFKTAEGLYARH